MNTNPSYWLLQFTIDRLIHTILLPSLFFSFNFLLVNFCCFSPQYSFSQRNMAEIFTPAYLGAAVVVFGPIAAIYFLV